MQPPPRLTPHIVTPSINAGGAQKMIEINPRSRQPARQPWTLEKLDRERAAAMGAFLDQSSSSAYNSHTQSYLHFCRMHNFPYTPTDDTLSYYVVYMCHHIKPESVDSYLTGICTSLEPYYPNIRSIRRSVAVTRTLGGCKKLKNTPVNRRRPLNDDDLHILHLHYGSPNATFDDKLFLTIILVGFHGLLRLGELTWPDNPKLRSWRKVTLRISASTTDSNLSFFLPFHKADRFFEGNTVIIEKRNDVLDPVNSFKSYLLLRDSLFPASPALWLRSDGSIPTYSWVRSRLSRHFSADVAGHSLRSGGATRLAELGVPDDKIQAIGRWASEAFRIYIRKNPVILHALIRQNGTQPRHQPDPHHP